MNSNEPIILGKVKKNGASKPILIIIIFLIIGSIILFVPTISNYFGDYSIIDLIKNGEIIDFIKNHNSYKNITNIENKNDNKEITNNINSKTIIKSNEFILNNFDLQKNKISFNVSKENIDLDNKNYYLILKQNEKELYNIKITNENTIDFTFKNSLNSIIDITGTIKLIKDNEYPKYTLSSDESGLASLICKQNNNYYEYIFDNNLLTQIKQTYNYNDNNDNELYLKEYENYKKLSETIINSGGISTIEENTNGFIFKTDINANNYNDYINRDYYSYNTNVNKIHFDMEAKGFDCQ